jgi:hypothetical protein
VGLQLGSVTWAEGPRDWDAGDCGPCPAGIRLAPDMSRDTCQALCRSFRALSMNISQHSEQYNAQYCSLRIYVTSH